MLHNHNSIPAQATTRRRWLLAMSCAICAASAGYASWTHLRRKRILIVTEIALIPSKEFDSFLAHMGGRGFLDEVGFDVEYLDSKIGDEWSFANAIQHILKNPPEMLVVFGDHEAVTLRQAVPNVPLFYWCNTDPTTIGLAESFLLPRGRATGATSDWAGNTKPVELIAELLRTCSWRRQYRVAVVANAIWFAPARMTKWNHVAAASGLALEEIAAETYAQLLEHPGWAEVEQYDAAILPISTPRVTHVAELVEYLSDRRVLNLFENFGALVKGGALGYQAVRPDWAVELGSAIRLVLEGAEPGEIPVRGPDAWTFAANQSALAQLGCSLTPASKALISHVF